MAIRLVPGYPMPVGAKLETIVDRDGPASYTGGAAGTDILLATDVGLGGFDTVDSTGISQDGVNTAVATLINMSAPGDPAGNAVPSARIRYFVAATGAEVGNGVNLSTKSFRFQIRGV